MKQTREGIYAFSFCILAQVRGESSDSWRVLELGYGVGTGGEAKS